MAEEPKDTDPKPPATDPVTPPATDPVTPPATDPAKPAATDPAKPAATDPAKPAATDPAKPAATDPAKPAAESAPAEPENPLAAVAVPKDAESIARAMMQHFAISKEGQALRKTDDAKNPDAIAAAMGAWTASDAVKDTPIAKAYEALPAEQKPSAAVIKSEFESTNRTRDFDIAFSAYIGSPEAKSLLMTDQPVNSKSLMTQFKGWVNDNKNPEIAALKESVNEAANTPALVNLYETRLSGLANDAKRNYRTAHPAPAPEEESMLSKNKFGGMGAMLGMLAGLFLGGPIGALIGLLIGAMLGSTQDGDGLLNNFMGGEKPTAQLAKPIKMKNMPKGKELVMVKADGAATQDYREADVIYMGHQEGKGENRSFVIENVMVRRNQSYSPDSGGEFYDVNNNPIQGGRAMPMLHAASGRLKMTSGGTVDVTDAGNQAVLNGAANEGENKLKAVRQDILQQFGVERDNAMQETMLKDAKDAQTAVDQMQGAMVTRLQQMGVSAEDQANIANVLGKKYADPKFREEKSVEARLADIMDEQIPTKDGNMRTVEAALLDAKNGGLRNEMGKGTDRFSRMFKSTSDNIVTAINSLPGDTVAPAPEVPSIARSTAPAAATTPQDLVEKLPELKTPVATEAELPAIALKEKLESLAVVEGADVKDPAAKAMAGLIAKDAKDAAELRFVEVELEKGGSILLSGKMQGDTFVADRVASGNKVLEASDVEGLKEAATRTFEVKDGKIANDGENAKRLTAMLANDAVQAGVNDARKAAAPAGAPATPTAPAKTEPAAGSGRE